MIIEVYLVHKLFCFFSCSYLFEVHVSGELVRNCTIMTVTEVVVNFVWEKIRGLLINNVTKDVDRTKHGLG